MPAFAFETECAARDDLTFEYMKTVSRKTGVAFDETFYVDAGMVDSGGRFTNVGLLVSDQCPSYMETVVSGEGESAPVSRVVHTGSIFKQLDDAYAIVLLNNKTAAYPYELYVETVTSYPETALRDALLNAVVHRDYGRRVRTVVEVTPSFVRISSPGGLASGIDPSDLIADFSVTRNRVFGDLLFRMNIVDLFGVGISRIIGAYRGIENGYRFDITADSFTVTLKNRNKPRLFVPAGSTTHLPILNESEAKVFRLLQSGARKREQLVSTLGISTTTALRILDKLQKTGLVVRMETTRGATYLPAPSR